VGQAILIGAHHLLPQIPHQFVQFKLAGVALTKAFDSAFVSTPLKLSGLLSNAEGKRKQNQPVLIFLNDHHHTSPLICGIVSGFHLSLIKIMGK